MDLKEEMDAYDIPRKKRQSIFKWGLGGGWSTAGALLSLLICCFYARIKENKDEKDKAKVNEQEMRQILMEKLKQDLSAQAAPVVQKAAEYLKSVDTLQQKADTIKQKL